MSRGLPERERDELFAVESCEAGICPRCGNILKFVGVVKVKEVDYGAGYYRVESPLVIYGFT